MAIPLRYSTASQEMLFGPFLDDTDGKTAETGLTLNNTDLKIWKTGATTEVSKNSGGGTHIASGRYYAVLDATDTDTLGPGEINIHVAGALPVRREFLVLPAVVYDALILGTDKLQVHADEITNGLITAAAIATGAIDADALATDAIDEIVDGVCDEALSGHTTAGTVGKALSDAASAGAPPSAAAIADAVWDEATAGHAGAGSTGEALTNAGGIGSPPSAATIADAVWDEARAGHVGAGSFGEGVVVSSLAAGAVTAAAVATGAIDADALATDAVNEIADGIMTRASSNWEASAPVKSLGTAVMKAVHKVEDDAGTLKIYQSDGTTLHASQTIGVDAANDPIDSLSGAA